MVDAVTRQMMLPTSSGDQQRQLLVERDAHGPSKRIAIGANKAGQYIDRITERLAISERYKDHPVATARFTVPRTVLTNENSVVEGRWPCAILGKYQSE